MTPRAELQAAAIALLASIAIGSVLILATGNSPAHVWWAMVARTATDPHAFGEVVYRAAPLVLTGLAVSIALDVGLFNIAGEAQLGAGVLACGAFGAVLPEGTPAVIALPLCVLVAAAAGAAVGAVIGVLRVARNAHEVITSIMINAIVAGVALWIGNAFLFRGGTTRGPSVAPGADLPLLGLGGSNANASVVLVVIVVAAVWWLRERTAWGHAWRAVGHDPEAARAVGISVGRVRILMMTLAGALAGLAATNFVLGHKHAFEEGLGRGTGFIGISAALLGRSHPIGVAVAAVFLGFLSASGLEVHDLVPKELTEMLQGVVVLAVACAVPWVKRRVDAKAATAVRGAGPGPSEGAA